MPAGDGQAEHQGAGTGTGQVVGVDRAAGIQGDRQAWRTAAGVDQHVLAEIDGEIQVLAGDIAAIGRHADTGDCRRHAIDDDAVLAADGVGATHGGQGQHRIVAVHAFDRRAVEAQRAGGGVIQVGAQVAGLDHITEGQGVAAGARNIGRQAVDQAGFQQQARRAARGIDNHRLVEGDGHIDDVAHLVAAIGVADLDVAHQRIERVHVQVDGVGVDLRAAATVKALVVADDLQ
ncbi:hypothetical protein D3C77_87430 [compost metagenome]